MLEASCERGSENDVIGSYGSAFAGILSLLSSVFQVSFIDNFILTRAQAHLPTSSRQKYIRKMVESGDMPCSAMISWTRVRHNTMVLIVFASQGKVSVHASGKEVRNGMWTA